MTTKTAKISLAILELLAINPGMNPIDAIKQVCGAEKVDAMIESLYNELRAKAK